MLIVVRQPTWFPNSAEGTSEAIQLSRAGIINRPGSKLIAHRAIIRAGPICLLRIIAKISGTQVRALMVARDITVPFIEPALSIMEGTLRYKNATRASLRTLNVVMSRACAPRDRSDAD